MKVGVWKHFWCKEGMDAILRTIFSLSFVNVAKFGTQLYAVEETAEGGITAMGGTLRPDKNRKFITQDFDRVICCAPASDSLRIDGFEEILGPKASAPLKSVEYDRRVVRAVFFKDDFAPKLKQMFGGKAELDASPEEFAECGYHCAIWHGTNAERKGWTVVATPLCRNTT